VWAVGVDDTSLARLIAEQDPFLAEVLDAAQLTGRQFLAIAHKEPSERNRQRTSLNRRALRRGGSCVPEVVQYAAHVSLLR